MDTADFLYSNLDLFVVPMSIMELTDLTIEEKMCYIVLRSFSNPRGDAKIPSYATIARLGSMSQSSARLAIQGLHSKGLLHGEYAPPNDV